MSGLDLYTQCARGIADLPEGWVGMVFKCVGHPANCQGVMVRGAVCPPKTRGPDKGEPNWAKRDRKTECEVFVAREVYRSAVALNSQIGERA